MSMMKASMDGGAISIFALAIVGALPTIAVLLTVIYYAFLIWESPSFQKIVGRLSQHLGRKQARKDIAAGAPLVVVQTPPISAEAVVVVQTAVAPQSPPDDRPQTS